MTGTQFLFTEDARQETVSLNWSSVWVRLNRWKWTSFMQRRLFERRSHVWIIVCSRLAPRDVWKQPKANYSRLQTSCFNTRSSEAASSSSLISPLVDGGPPGHLHRGPLPRLRSVCHWRLCPCVFCLFGTGERRGRGDTTPRIRRVLSVKGGVHIAAFTPGVVKKLLTRFIFITTVECFHRARGVAQSKR